MVEHNGATRVTSIAHRNDLLMRPLVPTVPIVMSNVIAIPVRLSVIDSAPVEHIVSA